MAEQQPLDEEMIPAIETPQSQPLTVKQVKNEAGGFVWRVDDMERFRRFLVLAYTSSISTSSSLSPWGT